MRNAALCRLLVVALIAGPALAQAPADATATQAPALSKKADGTVSGVTVMPMPKRTCSSRDKDCIAMVVAELKRDYPEQLKQFCFQEQTKAVRNQFVNDQIDESLRGNGPPTPRAFPVSPIMKTACAPDPK